MKRMRLYFDLDGVLVDLMAGWLPYLNEITGKDLTAKDVNMWGLENVYGIPFSKIRKPLHRPGFWENLPPYPGGVATVKVLHRLGYEVYIATAPFPSENCMWEKRLWVEKHLPFLDPANIIIIPKKHLLDGDNAALVDDKPENLSKFGGLKILWDQPWNKELPEGHLEWWYKRIESWDRLLELITWANNYGLS